MKYFFIIFLFISSTPVFSQIEKDSVNGPVITFFEKQFDFGDIIQGDTVRHIFQFKNTGNAPLKIKSAISNCSCTPSAGDTSRFYMPGETGEIAVNFNSQNKSGSVQKQGIVQKQITINSNALNAWEKVTIRVNVLPPVKKTSKSR